MVSRAEEREVVQLRFPALRPELEVMAVAPPRWPIATRKDAMPIPSHQRPARRRWDGARGMCDLVLQFPKPGDAGDRGIAGHPAHGLGRNGPSPLELARRRAANPGQR